MKATILLAAGLAILSCGAAAAEPAGPAMESPMPSLLRLALAFAGVIGLVYAVSFVLRRAGNRRRRSGSRLVNVVDVLPLGPKARLVTVKIGGRVVVVGAGESSVTRIAEIDSEEYRELVDGDDAPVIPFRDRLRRLAGK